MTTVVADTRMSQDMKDAIASALTSISTIQAASDLMNASAGQTLIVTDRIPLSASVLDHSTGLRTIVTDPAQIAAMLPGAYAFVGAASNGPDGTRDIVFDWSDIDLDGASSDGLPVLYVGSTIVDAPDHAYQVSGAYGMTTDMTLDRVIVNGVARAYADSTGAFEGGTIVGVDHGVGFAATVDGMAFSRGIWNPDHMYFDLMGPGGYDGGANGTMGYSLLSMQAVGMTSTFGPASEGGIAITITSDGTAVGAFTSTTTMMAPGHEVLGTTYENYVLSEFVGAAPAFYGDNSDLQMAYEASVGNVPQHTAAMMAVAGALMIRMDHSVQNILDSGPDDGASLLIADSLGLHGFSSHSFGQTRIVSASHFREINQSSTGVAYGVQVEGGDVHYDATGISGVGTDQNPSTIALDDRASTVDTVLVGTGRQENVRAGDTTYGNNTNELHDNRYTTNHIEAGQGDDVIITVRPETFPAGLMDIIHGNGGNDLILLNTIDSEAFGDDGDDVIAIGMGDQIAHGGAGYDTLSFEGNIYTYFGVNFDARTGFGEFVSDGVYHTTHADGFERIFGSNGDDVFVGLDGMTIDGQIGNDDITLGDMGIAIGGYGDDTFRLEVAQTGTAKYLLIGVDATDRLFLDGVQHMGSQAMVGQDGIDWRSGLGDNVWNTDRAPDADPLGDFWTEDMFNGTEQTYGGESLSKILIQHHVGGSVVASTEIFMTGFSNGDAGMTFDRVTSSSDGNGGWNHQVATAGTADYGLHMTQTALDVVDVFHPSSAPPVADLFGLV